MPKYVILRAIAAVPYNIFGVKSVTESKDESIVGEDIEYTTGRPPVFESPAHMQQMIEEYFRSPPTKTIYTKEGAVERPVLTITGLSLHLGFCSRQSFYDYEKRAQFSYVVKRARTLIECEYESMLQVGNTAGAIFGLKNFGWTDKAEEEKVEQKPLKVVITRAKRDD